MSEALEERAIIDGLIPLRDPALASFLMLSSITASGEPVNEGTAHHYTAYFSAINLLASTIASLPFRLQWDDKKGTQENELDNPFLKPNPIITAFQFWEYCIWCMLGWGNFYAQIIRDDTNRIIALWPIPPNQIHPKIGKEGIKEYTFVAANSGEKSCTMYDHEILHIPGMGYDPKTLKGKSIARLAQEAIGLGLSTEKFGATFFGNNAVPGGIITHPTGLTNNAKQTIEHEVEERLQGPRRSRRVIVLDEGMVYKAVGVSPEDGQFLQTRRFQVREICRWFRIPPHMLYDLDEATTGNIEQQSIGFTTYSLVPLMTRIIQSCESATIPARRSYKSYYYWYDTAPLLLMDEGTRLENYARGRNMGLYTLNDIRRKEKMPLLPADLGDTFLIPSTMKVYTPDRADPIDPKTITDTMMYLLSIPDLSAKELKAVIIAAMPTAEETLIASLVTSYTKKRDYDDDIVPLVKAPNETLDGPPGNAGGGGGKA